MRALALVLALVGVACTFDSSGIPRRDGPAGMDRTTDRQSHERPAKDRDALPEIPRVDQIRDARPPDGVVDGFVAEAGPDALLLDGISFDTASGDASCPPGLVRCGGVCVDLSIDFAHCGACDTPCAGGAADRCLGGTCICGGGSACGSGLNCVGGKCKCLPGGRCTGCCDGNGVACVPLGQLQSPQKCGTAGSQCQGCDDNDPCTHDLCTGAGSCLHDATANDGAPCDDGAYCTVGDTCLSGTCAGAPRDCRVFDTSCTKAQCSEVPRACLPDPLADGSPCGGGKGACCTGVCCGPNPKCCSEKSGVLHCKASCIL